MVARQIAPEIDRLVLSVNARAMENRRATLMEMADAVGLDSLNLLPQTADFLLAGRMTADLAVTRMRYWPSETVRGRLDELAASGFLEETADGYLATPPLRPILEAVLAGQAAAAAEMWSEHPTEVERASSIARQVIAAATGDHVVAVVHRDLPEPADPFGLLHRRLVTLRYIRQHDHAEAWSLKDLLPSDMVILTALWHRDGSPEGHAADHLVARGLVTEDQSGLTEAGLDLREAIEDETNRRAQTSFDVLDEATADEFLAILRRLPGEVD